jgi:hypothetical protein
MQTGCSNCQSHKIVRNVPVKAKAEVGRHIYMSYKNSESDWFSKEAQILGEICNNCGSVKLYVKQTNKIWPTY